MAQSSSHVITPHIARRPFQRARFCALPYFTGVHCSLSEICTADSNLTNFYNTRRSPLVAPWLLRSQQPDFINPPHIHTHVCPKMCPMIAQVKCPGDQDGKGCRLCLKKGVRCHYSVKQKPGPKSKKREVQNLGLATKGTEAPNNSSTPQRQEQHPLVTKVAGSKRGLDAGDGDDYAGGLGGESGSPLMASSSPSIRSLRPSKKPKRTHDEGYRSARQQAQGEHKRKNVPLQPKPAPLTEWLWGSGEDDSRAVSVHSGERAPLPPSFFHGVSPPSWTLATQRAPGDDSPGGARLDSKAGTFGAQRAFSGGAQLMKTTIEPGGNLDGPGGGHAGPVHTGDLFGNGGSFVFGFKGEEPSMKELLGPLNPLDSLIDQNISGDSDASSDSSAADDDEVKRGKMVMTDNYLWSYGTIRYTLVLQLH